MPARLAHRRRAPRRASSFSQPEDLTSEVAKAQVPRAEVADLVRRMAGRYRLPHALRRADSLARAGPLAATMTERPTDRPTQMRDMRHVSAFSKQDYVHKYSARRSHVEPTVGLPGCRHREGPFVGRVTDTIPIRCSCRIRRVGQLRRQGRCSDHSPGIWSTKPVPSAADPRASPPVRPIIDFCERQVHQQVHLRTNMNVRCPVERVRRNTIAQSCDGFVQCLRRAGRVEAPITQ